MLWYGQTILGTMKWNSAPEIFIIILEEYGKLYFQISGNKTSWKLVRCTLSEMEVQKNNINADCTETFIEERLKWAGCVLPSVSKTPFLEQRRRDKSLGRLTFSVTPSLAYIRSLEITQRNISKLKKKRKCLERFF